ncbi:MAG: response regulator transcription factor [Dehalococcoidales bacterium]|nr:response regulator transcription factor [Dehalococcoidales bacterium]
MSAKKILIVDDDKNLVDTLTYNLIKEGYSVVSTMDGSEVLELVRTECPDVVLLDIMLPGMNGFEICRILRKETTVPIMMLTAKTNETDKIVGLELGADDYITKPFSVRELMARIAAMLRRSSPVVSANQTDDEQEGVHIKSGDVEIDMSRYEVKACGKSVQLSPKEFALLAFLMQNKGHVFSREDIVERVWGYDYDGIARTVDVHIVSLRRKIEPDPTNPKSVVTVRGFGYKFDG